MYLVIIILLVLGLIVSEFFGRKVGVSGAQLISVMLSRFLSEILITRIAYLIRSMTFWLYSIINVIFWSCYANILIIGAQLVGAKAKNFQVGLHVLSPVAIKKACFLYLHNLLNRAYNSLEWCLNSPPKPHAFVSLPLQS